MTETDHPSLQPRIGEIAIAVDPGGADDARLAFIGRVRSPWLRREDCPKNMREARARGRPAGLEIDAPYRPALDGLEVGVHIHLLTWLDRAQRDLAVQRPRLSGAPRGTFALRSPVRPNPIGLHLVRVLDVDRALGRIAIDAVDVLDGTPLLDIKPYLETIDRPPREPDA